MGEVYRARDARLGRDVALKVLRLALTAEPDRRARVEREARTLASLNHPNIATIHGVEDSGGVPAIVMELVEGPTLAERTAQGPIPVPEALAVARQITLALEAAHEKGIIHRDLKPANVKLTAAGAVKVLDFGLAKAVEASAADLDVSTRIGRLTVEGAIVGTAAYMSPEQARGQVVDRRTDIWAFGCVFYEISTGRSAFAGPTFTDTVANVLGAVPDLERLPAETPPAIRRLLRRCLNKDAANRLHHVSDARIEIDEAAREPVPEAPTPQPPDASRWRPLAWAATGAAIALLASTMIPGRTDWREESRSLVASSLPIGETLTGQPGIHIAVAPDGNRIVFPGVYGGRSVLYRRDLSRIDPEPIVGTETGSDAFFSPDGRRLGFEIRSELWIAPLDGGSPRRVLPNQPLRGGTWGDGDTIVVGRVGTGLWLVSGSGGEPRQLTHPKDGERHELPQLLPGGRALLFTIFAANGPPQAAAHILTTGETRALFEGIGARFAGSGHIVFGRQGKLWAVSFDPDALETRGSAQSIRDDIFWSSAGYPQFAIDGGVLAYVRQRQGSTGVGKVVPALVDRKGQVRILPLPPDNYGLSRFSPAGDRLIIQVGAARDLWTFELSGGAFARLPSDRIIAYSAPAWTPDGKRVVFTTWFDGEVGLGWIASDGSGPVQLLAKGAGLRSFERTHPAMHPDGRGVIMTGLAPGATVEDLLVLSWAGEPRLETLLQAPGVERNPAIAPNGRFIAYNSDESGRSEVYVRPFPKVTDMKKQASTNGGGGPVWTKGGREIVYSDREGRMIAVAVQEHDSGEIRFSKPEVLFEWSQRGVADVDRGFDVTADGERFLFLIADKSTAGTDRLWSSSFSRTGGTS